VHVLSTQLPDLNAAVPFYGNTPAPSEAAKVKAPLLVHRAAIDERINAAWPAYEAALKAAGVKYTEYQYAGTQHGFNNDATPRHDAAAAKLAWDRTIGFFKANLSSGTGAAAARPVWLRGTLQAVTDSGVTVKTRAGETVQVPTAANLSINEVFPVELASIRPGNYIGVASLPQADGSLKAIAMTLFPESLRGLAEGHYPFDLMPDSMMTNATVEQVTAASSGQRLQVRYRDGDKVIVVPAEAPVVSFRPADRGLLVPGASVSVIMREVDGKPTAQRISAGRNGFAVPY
jgi:hypothetical protein